MKNEENNHDIGTIETLETNNTLKKDFQDIPTAFFKPITEVQTQQTEILDNYNKKMDNSKDVSIPDLTEEVRILEKKLAAKKFSMSFFSVLLLVIVINLCWFVGVKFLIVPKYEEYIAQNKEIKENYDYLKRSINAIVDGK